MLAVLLLLMPELGRLRELRLLLVLVLVLVLRQLVLWLMLEL